MPPVRASEVQPVAEARDPKALLPPSLRASLGAARWVDVDPGGKFGADYYAMGYEVPAVVDAKAIDEAQVFAMALRQSCRPLDEEDLLVELGKLRMKVARKAEDQHDTVLLMEAYCEELREYPADIVMEVLRLWPRLSKFWPTLDDLRGPIDWRVRQRAGLLKALEEVASRATAEKAA